MSRLSGPAFFALAAAGMAAILGAVPAGASTCSSVSACVFLSNTSSGPAAQLTSAGGYGLEGMSTSNTGILGTSQNGDGIDGKTSAAGTSSSNARSGVAGYDLSSNGTHNFGIFGQSPAGTGVHGTTTNGTGVSGVATSKGTGVYGSGPTVGVQGTTASQNGIGVLGTSTGNEDISAAGVEGSSTYNYGLYGISTYGDGVFATSTGTGVFAVGGGTDGTGVYASSNYGQALQGVSTNGVAISGESMGNGPALDIDSGGRLMTAFRDDSGSAPAEVMSLDHAGNLILAGSLTTYGSPDVVTTRGDGRHVVSFAPRETQASIEDVGEARVVAGSASVPLDPAFAATIDQRAQYLVFLTAEGDNRGLYVAQKSAAGFVVRESQGGRSSLLVQYRIVAKPYDAPAERLPADRSATVFAADRAQHAGLAARRSKQIAHAAAALKRVHASGFVRR